MRGFILQNVSVRNVLETIASLLNMYSVMLCIYDFGVLSAKLNSRNYY